LTFDELLDILEKTVGIEEEPLVGNIRTKEVCPECGRKFVHLTHNGRAKGSKQGLVCPVHLNIRPGKYYLDLGRTWDKVYCDSHGKPLTSFRQAHDVQKEIDGLISTNKFRPDRYKQKGYVSRTVSGLIEDFFDGRAVAPSCVADYKRHIKAAADFFPDQDVNTLDDIDIDRLVKHLRKTHPDWKPKTLKNYVDDFHTFMAWAGKKLKFAVPSFPKIEVQPPEMPEWVERDEQEALAEASHEPMFHYLFIYGHRPCMARALLVKDVDPDQLTITVNRRRFSRNTLMDGPAKKGKAGTLPIMPDEHPRLAAYILERCRAAHPDAFLFPNPRTGGAYSQDAAGRLWRAIRKRLDIKDSVKLYHVTRHSVASILLNQGYSFEEIGELLCVSPEMLRKHYAHHDVSRKKAILASMKTTKIEHKNNIRKLDRRPNVAPEGIDR
jgi:site-specific recombinase XerD